MLRLMFVICLQEQLSAENSFLLPKVQICHHSNPLEFVGALWLLPVELSLKCCLLF